MQQVQLGRGGPTVSRLGLGTMMMGWRMDAAQSTEVLATALDQGITLVDSSVSYARGGCHQILGEAIKTLKARQRIVLATKVGGISNDNDPPEWVGVSAANIIRQCDLSLQQLQTDCIDLLQLHIPSDTVPPKEQLEALEQLRKAGKIIHYGVCNHSLAQMQALDATAQLMGVTGLVSHQFSYNLLEQEGREDLLTQCADKGWGSIIWGPLSSGLLTDHYAQTLQIKEGSRIGVGRERHAKEHILSQPTTQAILQDLAQQAQQTGRSVQKLAIDWLLKKTTVTSVLLGPSSRMQLDNLLQSF